MEKAIIRNFLKIPFKNITIFDMQFGQTIKRDNNIECCHGFKKMFIHKTSLQEGFFFLIRRCFRAPGWLSR